MAFIKFNTTVESKALDTSLIPISDGQFLIVTDTQKLMYDNGTKRLVLGDIIELDTEAQRSALVTPLSKFYFVKETGVLWRYNSGSWMNWLDGETIKQHIDHLIATEDGVHGIRYSNNALEVKDSTTGEWKTIPTGGGESNAVECTLTVAGWSAGRNTISVAGLGADTNGVIGLTQNISTAAMEAVRSAEMYVCGQADGTLTIAADGEIPTCDIPVVVILLS